MSPTARVIATVVAGLLLAAVSNAQHDIPVEESEDFSHEASGIVFPHAVAEFRRVSLSRYDELANNVSAGFGWENRRARVILTVFVYPVPQIAGVPISLRTQFDTEQGAIRQYHPGTLDIERDEVTVSQNGQRVPGFMSELILPPTEGGFDVRVSSVLYLFQHNTWSIKFRASFPERNAPEASAAIETFVDAFAWGDVTPRKLDEPIYQCDITVSPALTNDEAALAAWIAYGSARVQWRTENTTVPIVEGQEPPTFDEEVAARELLLIGWQVSDGSGNVYLETFARVADAGFLKEYVHTYLIANPAWMDTTDVLGEFELWRAEHLVDHRPEAYAGIDCK